MPPRPAVFLKKTPRGAPGEKPKAFGFRGEVGCKAELKGNLRRGTTPMGLAVQFYSTRNPTRPDTAGLQIELFLDFVGSGGMPPFGSCVICLVFLITGPSHKNLGSFLARGFFLRDWRRLPHEAGKKRSVSPLIPGPTRATLKEKNRVLFPFPTGVTR
ncbi:hypothetical protein JTE90_011663 [Oedothorax gibbosus]|uniref:Uncharacterized protein n=1 Tax=Oedothorax gibbosus TaxID=931172 RepID=A0AAV6TEK3_9ARAC|nr:hypothetical protein JTE90_011663 [Oedothorax gibbosus]